ncbi:MAG: hypothetical protein ACYS8W_18005 [Planctomycetota bacterium]|jgi:hypothetical protein
MSSGRYVLSVASLLCVLLVLPSPARGIEWVKDFDAGLDEAYERGAPAFIFLAQAT